MSRRVLIAIVLGAFSVSADVASAKPPQDAVRCTIMGGPGADVLRGRPGRDVICGRGGADRLLGRGGRDVMRGGPGRDRLEGNAGDDLIGGGTDRDDVLGDFGDDILDGGPGADYVEGGPGKDECDFADFDDALDTSCIFDYSVTSVKLAPTAVDTSTSDQQVVVSARVTTASEIERELLQVRALESAGPEPLQSYSFEYEPPFDGAPGEPLQLVAGDPADGVWSGSITVPRGSPTGEHRLSMLLIDRTPDRYSSTPIWAAGLARAKQPYTFTQTGAASDDGSALGVR